MTIQRSIFTCCLWLATFVLIGFSPAWADELDRIRFGEAARSFAAGSIQMSTPQNGVVNVITGDNQTVGNRMRLGQNDVFYLRLKNPGEAMVGDLYTVFKRARKVFHPSTGKYMGYLVNRLAIVQVVQVDDVLTSVRALRAYGPVSPGDPVIKFSLPTEAAAIPTSSSGELTGTVVDLQSDMKLTLVAQRNIVYLDKGSEDGLRTGANMELVRHGGGLPPRSVGEVKVLSTEGHTATGLITKSTSRILKGDRFRTKMQSADLIPLQSSERSDRSDTSPTSSDAAAGRMKSQEAGRETRYSLSDAANQLHFESGEATIRPEGYQLLDKLAGQLNSSQTHQMIRVEGHADSMEIGPSLQTTYPTNWELSKARAAGVVRYLITKGGIDSARIVSVGYGDTRPLSSNAMESGRQQNRRVEIVIYSPETAGAPSQQPVEQAEQAEQVMKPTEAVEEGYGVSRLEAVDGGSPVPPVDSTIQPDPTKIENSSAVPSSSLPSVPDTAQPAGDQTLPEPTEQPVPPAQN